jgi:hypothetical protein
MRAFRQRIRRAAQPGRARVSGRGLAGSNRFVRACARARKLLCGHAVNSPVCAQNVAAHVRADFKVWPLHPTEAPTAGAERAQRCMQLSG